MTCQRPIAGAGKGGAGGVQERRAGAAAAGRARAAGLFQFSFVAATQWSDVLLLALDLIHCPYLLACQADAAPKMLHHRCGAMGRDAHNTVLQAPPSDYVAEAVVDLESGPKPAVSSWKEVRLY